MEASGGAATHVLAYLRGNPVMMLAAVAVLFGIGFGLYVYLQIASPGMFVKKAATQAAQPPAAPASAQPPGIPAPTSEVAGSATPGTLVNTPVAANAPSSGAIAAPMPAPAETPASGVTAPAGLQARLPGADPAPAAPGPGLIATSSVLTSSGRVDAPPANERAPEPRLERAANRTSSDVPRPAPAAPREAARTDSPGREQIAVSPTTVQPTVNPQVSQAYALLQSGSLDEARTLYNRVVQAEPLNIDALLGIAYIAAQENRSEDALKAYLRILQLTPRHAIAQAALIGLMGRADPIASETRLKQLLAREPSAFLHFVLGNLYADQSLWNQAQQAYFQAHHLEPDNPDFAYNLAVGLDHLRQSKLALDFYRRAERLATQQGRSNFNLSHARERISSLTSQLE
ncbi:MAG: tetratricopeptide repeat protein [Burkholderiales bacterium]